MNESCKEYRVIQLNANNTSMKSLHQLLTAYDISDYDQFVTELYHVHDFFKNIGFIEKVVRISGVFLGRPYILGPNGEGPHACYDQAPLYRFDGFDCVTFVNTVLAFAFSDDVDSFQKHLIDINYHNGELGYEKRHHFMSADWNPCNQALGLIEDVTDQIIDEEGVCFAEQARALIDRPAWLRRRTSQDIRLLSGISDGEVAHKLNELHSLADHMSSKEATLPYLPLSKMFDMEGAPKLSIFKQIPNGSIIEIVRPNWDLKDQIGTNLNISHVGFLIEKDQTLLYRQASSIKKAVCDVPLIEYLSSRLKNPTIKGINVQRIIHD